VKKCIKISAKNLSKKPIGKMLKRLFEKDPKKMPE
jgi:hypothetical protein